MIEKWDYAKCLKMSKQISKDGLGTKYPFAGYIGCSNIGSFYCNNPLPIIHSDFQIELIRSWGYRIILKASTDKNYRGIIQSPN